MLTAQTGLQRCVQMKPLFHSTLPNTTHRETCMEIRVYTSLNTWFAPSVYVSPVYHSLLTDITSYVLGLCLEIQTSNWTCTWTLRQFPLLPQILSNSKCAPQIVALPLVSFSTSVLQRCKQPSRTDSSSSVMCLGAGCIGRSGGIRDCVNGLCITDLCTGDVLGTSEDEGPCCSTVLHSLTRWNTKIESSHIQTENYTIKISF